MEILELTHSIFRKKFERSTESNFKPYFYRFIGVENEEKYNSSLKTLELKCDENKSTSIIFDNDLPLIGEMELIQYIYNELNTMDIFNISKEEITIFNDFEVNLNFLKALEYVISIAVRTENFFNDSVRNNFITKLIVWAYSFLKDLDYKSDLNPRCIYYGNIDRHAIYFLIMLNRMNFDVIYINPLKEEHWDSIDIDHLSIREERMGISQIESFKEKAAKGKVIDNVESITKKIQRDVERELFSGTGMYMPWQFRDGYTKSVLIDGIVEDLYSYWQEQAKLRQGFKVEGDLVTVPCFFKKIDGQYRDVSNFKKLVDFCVKSPNTIFFNNGMISDETKVNSNMYELMFSQLSDGSFDIEEIKKTSLYSFTKYSEEVQNLLLNKFNEAIKDKNIFAKQLTKEDKLKFLVLVLSMNENIIRLIDNFDFTSYVPKLVVYLNDEDKISDNMLMLFGYLHTIGMDIVIFNPSGLLNITNIINSESVNITRLDEMNYNSKYKSLSSTKQGFLSKILDVF